MVRTRFSSVASATYMGGRHGCSQSVRVLAVIGLSIGDSEWLFAPELKSGQAPSYSRIGRCHRWICGQFSRRDDRPAPKHGHSLDSLKQIFRKDAR